jgi:hypothetical protein
MASISDQLLAVYVFVDDWLKSHPGAAQWRLSPNVRPAFSDAEVIAIAVMQGCLGTATLKRTYQVIAGEYASAFPRLCSYAQWLARLHALAPITGQLVVAAICGKKLPARVYVIDAKPIPVCKPLRHGRARLLRDDGAYFGNGSTGWFFGFKLHVLIHASGCILSAVLTPGNWNERDVATALGLAVQGGVVLADLGYRSKNVAPQLAEEAQLLMITPADAEGEKRRLISTVRERVETTLSQLWSRFVDRVLSRSWDGLWNTIKLKMLHLNLGNAGLIPA